MKTPIENVTEFILRNSTGLSTPERIRLYEDTCELIPRDNQRTEIKLIISSLRAADQACREFSFIDHTDQI